MSRMREIAWPNEFGDLKRMEESMVCGICYEVMETSVMTPCSHNYCSVCIRKYLHYKTQCPMCFQNLFEKDLYINRAMDSLIEQYTLVREKLLILIQNRIVYNTVVQERDSIPSTPKDNTPSTPPARPARSNQTPRSSKNSDIKISEPKTPIQYKTPVIHSPITNSVKCEQSSPSVTASPKIIPSIAKIFNTTPKRKETVTTDVNVKTVNCPVCNVDIPETKVNLHLDACLKREVEEKKVQQKPKVQKRAPLPKLVLRVMKDAELKKKMKELGLPIQGDRRTLESRFHRYSVIYNSECDKIIPRPVADLIRQCEMEEKQERKMDSFLVSATPVVRLQVERNASDEKNEEARKAYSTANKSSFEKLIEEVKNRRRKEQEQSEQQVKSSSMTSNNENTDRVVKSCPENGENVIPSSDVTFDDSDSDGVCPLQHYNKDDLTNFCSVNLNDSNSCTSAASTPAKKPLKTISVLNKNQVLARIDGFPNSYELSTDEMSEDESPASPVLKGKTSKPKRVKLSKKISQSDSPSPSSSKVRDGVEAESQEAAKKLCNSIIEDFSCGSSNDSSNGCMDKRLENDSVTSTKCGKAETEENLLLSKTEDENVRVGDGGMRKQTPASLDTSLTESLEAFASDILNGDSLDGFADKRISVSIIQENETVERTENVESEKSQTEKENDGLSANENSLLGDETIRRPIRKRNRPSRYATEQSSTESEKTADHDLDEILDATDAVSDGSLKRRRGRAKASDALNPPKRPVRRRQPVSENNQDT